MWLMDIANHLEAAGVGTVGVDLFLGPMPEEPVSCGALIPYPGAPPEQQFGAEGAWLEKPRCQFSWRAADHSDFELALSKGQLAFDALTGVQTRTVGSTKVYRIQVHASPSVLFQDEAGRSMVGFNLTVEFEV